MNPLDNSPLVFIAAIVFGLVLPGFSGSAQVLIVPALIVSMVLSMREVDLNVKDFVASRRQIAYSLFLNYVFLSAVVIAGAYLFVGDADYVKGFIIMAAIPPAVAVVPFTFILKGDSKVALLSEMACYLFSLLYTPLLILAFLGVVVDIRELIQLLILLIVVPLAISRLVKRLDTAFFRHERVVMNLCFFVISYGIIGLNQRTIVSDAFSLIPVFVVLFLRTYVTAAVAFLVNKAAGVSKKTNLAYTLFASYKNGGAAAAIALLFFGANAALPAGVSAIFEMTLIILLQKAIKGD